MDRVGDTGLLRVPDEGLSDRLAQSAATVEGPVTPDAEVRDWIAASNERHRHEVRRIPFAELRAWSFEPGTGNLRHDSGRFFSVEGLRVQTASGPVREWCQPIIHQPEIGIGSQRRTNTVRLSCWTTSGYVVMADAIKWE